MSFVDDMDISRHLRLGYLADIRRFKKWLKKWDCQRNPVNEVMPDNATRSKIMKEKNAKDETVSKC